VSLVTFDDLPAALVLEPFLTVAAQPAYEMGRQAPTLLLDRLADRGPAFPCEIILPTEIIVRASSGPPPAVNHT
jgi:LacI family transcriptional regulator